jgi:(S)-3,5-dihydroxyphenylglycine transaminase
MDQARVTGVTQIPLYGGLADPVFSAMEFLNEITSRYPRAISFAPGAPNERFFATVDVPYYLSAFAGHLRGQGLSETAVRRMLYQYGPSRGIISELVATALRKDEGIKAPDRAVVITVGAQEAMFLALRVLHAAARDALGVVAPAYVGITGAARLLGVPVIPVAPLDDRGAGVRAEQVLADAVSAATACRLRIRTLYVAPDFANPSGARLSLDQRRELLSAARQHDIIVLEDNAYGFTASDANRLPTLKALDADGRVVHIGTFAKIAVPGARVGFLIADQQVTMPDGGTSMLADVIAMAKGMVTVNTSPLAQALVGGMLLANGCSLRLLGEQKAAFYRANLAFLGAALDRELGTLRRAGHDISWHVPEGGLFTRVRLPFAADNELLQVSAQDFGVLWTPMRYFHLGHDGDNEMRLSCSSLDERLIEQGLSRIRSLLNARLGQPRPARSS